MANITKVIVGFFNENKEVTTEFSTYLSKNDNKGVLVALKDTYDVDNDNYDQGGFQWISDHETMAQSVKDGLTVGKSTISFYRKD